MKQFMIIVPVVIGLNLAIANLALAFKPIPSGKSATIEIEEFLAGKHIRGSVKGLPPSRCGDYKVLIYVRTDKWYIHPYANGGDGLSFATLNPSCHWKIETVTRSPVPTEIALLLVDKKYNAPPFTFSLLGFEFLSIYVREWKELTRPWNVKRLSGDIGSSRNWGSGWLDLWQTMDFKKGDTLRLTVGGTASQIVVRLLSAGTDPNTPSGIDGGIISVPDNRVVDMVLSEDHENVVQISVHGGSNVWGLFPLGGGNGPASLVEVEIIGHLSD